MSPSVINSSVAVMPISAANGDGTSNGGDAKTQQLMAAETIQKLLDFSNKFDIGLLDRVIDAMYNSPANSQEQKVAQQVLTAFKEHPDAWSQVDTILEYSGNVNSKYYALQILESVITTKWKVLDRSQCEAIKKYIAKLVMKTSSNAERLEKDKAYLNKLNMILVQILKREWPNNWSSFVPDILDVSRRNESVCQNNMVILKLMSEELFDFSVGQLTQTKIKHLKDTMCSHFGDVFELCISVLQNSQNLALVEVTLETLLCFFSWIPTGYIFETNVVDILISKFLHVPMFRNVSLKCLTEIASIQIEEYDAVFLKLFASSMDTLVELLPLDTDIKTAYASGQDMDQKFIQDLALFLCTFLRQHAKLVESKQAELGVTLFKALHYVLLISVVEDVEIFKICIEFWTSLTYELYRDSIPAYSAIFMNSRSSAQQASGGSNSANSGSVSLVMVGNWVYEVPNVAPGQNGSREKRIDLYKSVLTRLRQIIISRMARPEEVLVVENDNGEVVREFMRDTDSITLYKNMRETLVYLTHLNHSETEVIMLDKLKEQIEGSTWSWKSFNSLCWAIGSISGTMSDDDEIRLIVTVIRELLVLCERKTGKDNKAIIAANIMYIVGQYPRFLRQHWRFLKTVVVKLFEFMHETHDGVQDMACDTFLKIAQKCKREFVITHADDRDRYIDILLADISMTICDLQPQQIHSFYEAVGYMISAAHDEEQAAWIEGYMRLPNTAWDDIVRQAAESGADTLREPQVVQRLACILKTNVRAAKALGHAYILQLGHIYLDMLNVYRVMSSNIATAIQINGEQVVRQPLIKSMRVVRKETLRLFSTWVHQSNDPQVVMSNFISPLLDTILNDYQSCSTIVACREPEVLSCIATIINKLQSNMTSEVPRIFDSVFQCTLEMINKDMEEYPEHRISFYQMVGAINQHCFDAVLAMSTSDFRLILDSIIWAIKHMMRNVTDIGLTILNQLLQNISSHEQPNAVQGFYRTFYMPVLEYTLATVSDSSHSASLGLLMPSTILALMFQMVETPGKIFIRLRPSDADKPAAAPNDTESLRQIAAENVQFITENVSQLLKTAFPHLSDNQIKVTVQGFFTCDTNINLFKEHLRDFLIQIRELSGKDDTDLFLEEREMALKEQAEKKREAQASVPGVLTPYERTDEMQETL